MGLSISAAPRVLRLADASPCFVKQGQGSRLIGCLPAKLSANYLTNI